MAEKFKSFNIDHVPRRQNAHAYVLASLAVSLALPAWTTEKILVQNRDLYCLKFAHKEVKLLKGNLQVKEVFETSTGPEPRD